MDKVLNAIKCHHCKGTLTIPVILPCGHSICKIHADDARDQVKCPKCGVSHQKQEFVIVTELLEMIESQIGSMDFGPCHKEAKEACDKLEDVLHQIDSMIKDPIYFSHQSIDELKNKVLLKSEQLKLAIDENAQKLLVLLSEYQKSCELNFEKTTFYSRMKNVEDTISETQEMLKDSLDFLNKLRVNDEKWRSIKQACDSKVEKLNNELESVKKLILMDEFEETTAQVDHFVDIDPNPLFQWKLVRINSEILDDERKRLLLDMCKIIPLKKWILLYRGSRDGFGAKDFHAKCDHIPNTVTVIKTTTGYIFGGYTEQTWNGQGYSQDPKAFIFSFSLSSSFVMKIRNPEFAIVRNQSYGPIFGNGNDICILNNSNTANNSSRINNFCLPDNYINDSNILAGSEIFQVKEIEVFKLA